MVRQMAGEELDHDVVVVGGGLGGMAAAFRLAHHGRAVALIDDSLPKARGQLGGFAKFSGAKFSFLPAGQGLIDVAGSVDRLEASTDEVVALLELPSDGPASSFDLSHDQTLQDGSMLRAYDSIVLTPTEIDGLLSRLESRVAALVVTIKSRVLRLQRTEDQWLIFSDSGLIARSPAVIFAGGRRANQLLREAGAVPQEGKGLDVGIRVEFLSKEAIQNLRAQGPDAKILLGNCRTFCLNYPGEVMGYDFEGITIPGGIVADHEHPSANVGLLRRVKDKSKKLAEVRAELKCTEPRDIESAPTVSGEPFQDKRDLIVQAYGEDIASELTAFAQHLARQGMVDWSSPHRIHFPLLDWHWDIFSIGATHATSLPGLYVVGDSAGHARGLLQAAISGWLGADEVIANARR